MAATFMSVIDRTHATIQFEPDGTILTANENFLKTVGYSLSEVAGRHHSMFVDRTHAQTEDYRRFWQDLAGGKSFTDQFPRVRKDGSVTWLQATYAPDLDTEGKVRKVIKIATDITERQRGIEGIAEGLRELGNGDLMHRVPSCNAPDIDALGNAFNAALDQLSTSISAVKEVSSAVERTADEIGQSSADLSHRTESQAATLEQTAAAIEELTSTARAAADGAREVEASANDVKSTAENGGKVVGEAIDAMSRIEKSSTKISQIITAIDDIAFQTNLLALNAGVEAARAGDAGRGFAVVASEVRALAGRASEAAREINALIEESAQHVKTGVGLVGLAGDELQKIIEGVAGIHANISEISRGAAEQAVTLHEINTGVGHLDSMTQQNAAMVEESTAASQVLANDARELARQVALFRTPSDSNARIDDGRAYGAQAPHWRAVS